MQYGKKLASYYQILGVSRDASPESVKKAFRCKAKLLHPDMDKGATAEGFQKINEAYQVLSDEMRRKEYDLQLKSGIIIKQSNYRPVKVYRPYGPYYNGPRKNYSGQASTVFERILDLFLFFSLILIGLFAVGFGVYRLWQEPIEGVNPVNGIIMGVVLTVMLAAGRIKWNKIFG